MTEKTKHYLSCQTYKNIFIFNADQVLIQINIRLSWCLLIRNLNDSDIVLNKLIVYLAYSQLLGLLQLKS